MKKYFTWSSISALQQKIRDFFCKPLSLRTAIDWWTQPGPKPEVIRKRYPNFDWLRIYFAFEVVLEHIWGETKTPIQIQLIHPVAGFLALSGFLVLQSYEQTGNWFHFIWKRVCRLIPALFISFILVLILRGPGQMVAAVINWLSLAMAPGAGGNPVLWSLGWEEIAYLLLAILFAIKFYKHPWLCLAIAVLSTEPLRQIKFVQIDWGLGWLLPAFLIGNFVYIKRDWLSKMPSWVPFGLLACYFYVLPGRFPWVYNVIFSFFCVVLIGAFGYPLLKRRIPDISYGLYLYHYPILYAVKTWKSDATWVELLGWTLLFVIPLTLASFYFVESPALKWKDRILFKQPRT